MITMKSKFRRPRAQTPPDTLNVERHWYEYARKTIDSQRNWLTVASGLIVSLGLSCAGITWNQQAQIRALQHDLKLEHCSKIIGLGEPGQVLTVDGWMTPDQHAAIEYGPSGIVLTGSTSGTVTITVKQVVR